MKIEDYKEYQGILLQIMNEVHRVCIENNLRYYLIGGSAIGAVRHKGIIPWDNDLDIAMPRSDYEKLINIYSSQLDNKYRLIDYTTEKDFRTTHALVVLNNSEIAFKSEINRPECKRYGIFIDILPLDQCPNSNRKQYLQEKKLLRIKNIRYRRNFPIHNSNGKIVVIIKKIIRYIYNKLYSLDYLNKKQHQIMQQYNNVKNCKYWCSMASHYSYQKLKMPIEYFGTPRLMEFSGFQFYVPEKVELYLSCLFGDYMRLPAIEKQQEQINSIAYVSWGDRTIIG